MLHYFICFNFVCLNVHILCTFLFLLFIVLYFYLDVHVHNIVFLCNLSFFSLFSRNPTALLDNNYDDDSKNIPCLGAYGGPIDPNTAFGDFEG